MFKNIDIEKWPRKPFFDQYLHQMQCTYSITVNLDITKLMEFRRTNQYKLYPVLLYVLSQAVNTYDEFRTAFDSEGQLGIWSEMHPSYTIFHKESKTFSSIWTSWSNNLEEFINNFNIDMQTFGNREGIMAKPHAPANVFPVSILPWTSFTGFNLNIQSDGKYLLPIFTFGKYFSQDNKLLIPLALQVHHAVCDGFHASRFVNTLQDYCNNLGQ